MSEVHDEICKLHQTIDKLEKLLKRAETYISIPEIVSHEERVSLREAINKAARSGDE
jgi:hypothetical protein